MCTYTIAYDQKEEAHLCCWLISLFTLMQVPRLPGATTPFFMNAFIIKDADSDPLMTCHDRWLHRTFHFPTLGPDRSSGSHVCTWRHCRRKDSLCCSQRQHSDDLSIKYTILQHNLYAYKRAPSSHHCLCLLILVWWYIHPSDFTECRDSTSSHKRIKIPAISRVAHSFRY